MSEPMSEPLTIGDYSRDGLVQIVDTNWGEYDPSRNVVVLGELNGTLLVTVREMVGERSISNNRLEQMRRLAKRTYLGATNARTVKQYYTGCQTQVMFAISPKGN